MPLPLDRLVVAEVSMKWKEGVVVRAGKYKHINENNGYFVGRIGVMSTCDFEENYVELEMENIKNCIWRGTSQEFAHEWVEL